METGTRNGLSNGITDAGDLTRWLELYIVLGPDFETPESGPVAHVRDDQPPEVQQIEEVLDRTVRPYLQGDGGDLDVLAYEDNRVLVSYAGACGTCPASVSGTRPTSSSPRSATGSSSAAR